MLRPRKHSVDVFIPFFHSKGGHVKGIEIGFEYQKCEDRYVCPTGKFLYPYHKKTHQYKRYRAKSEECFKCPIQDSCLNTSLKTIRPKWINRNIEQELLDTHLKKTETELFKQKLQERMWKAEGIMAQLKFYHGLNRARFRSIAKVQMQAWVAAITVNLKRLAKIIPLEMV